MDVCTQLERRLRLTPLAEVPAWACDPVLGVFETFDAAIAAIRRRGATSDRVVTAILAMSPGDEFVGQVLLAALAPMAKARCRGVDDFVNDLAAELAIVIAEAHRSGLPPSRRTATSVLLDRAWDRYREPFRRPGPVVPWDPAVIGRGAVCPDRDPGEVAVDRVALCEFREGLERGAAGHLSLVRAWNSVVELMDGDRCTRAQQDRWKYARKALRRTAHPDLVA
jgi:hypothetical protein